MNVVTPQKSLYPGKELARLKLQPKREWVPGAVAFVRTIAEEHGFVERDLLGVELATEELCFNAVEHAGSEMYELCVELGSDDFIVAVEDHGEPFDLAAAEKTGLGMKLIRGFADHLQVVYRGGKRKRVEFRKTRPRQTEPLSAAFFSETERGEHRPPVTPDEPLTIRLMTPEDGEELARCIWRVYGYTYPDEAIYDPERMARRLRSGELRSCIAVRESGEILGHIALVFDSSSDRVPESGKAVVAPYARGLRLMERMKSYLGKISEGGAIAGFFSEAIATHPFSQKTNLQMKATETGVLIGYIPANVNLKGISESDAVRHAPRFSAVIFYLRISQEPRRTSYLPARHREVARKIYLHGGFDRELPDVSGMPVAATFDAPEFSITEVPTFQIAFIRALAYGTDWKGHLCASLERVCSHGAVYVMLDLPLSDPRTTKACEEAEALGFFFAAIIPEKLPSGDLLRMQFLNKITVDPASVVTASEFGAELLDYVVQCQSR